MKKQNETASYIADRGGVPTLFVNGKPFTSAAYMTYLEKFNEYNSFTEAGYGFFSAPVLFSGRWISVTDGLTPFKKGIFDEKGKPDFAPLDEAINKILDACPDAMIIPRVNIAMPVWWEKENPADVNILADGSTRRESFYSEKWRADVSDMLRLFVRYVSASGYSSHIIGYQIACGNTEEWFHYDLNGGYCKNAEPGFEKFLKKYYPSVEYKGLPDLSPIKENRTYLDDGYLTRFLEYCGFAAADAVTYLASVVKEETGDRLVVGAFYGYSLEVPSPLHGSHALKTVLESRDIDFICSPNSYIGTRDPGIDWTEMYAADSVRLHGKMCFQECDIRTHLTRLLSERDPGTDPHGLLIGAIWEPVGSKEQARFCIRKSFARQLIKGNGLWWFDMWGGWYDDPEIMSDMAAYRSIYEESLACESRKQRAETAVFVDETASSYLADCPLRNAVYTQREELGLTGAPYDMFDVFDFESVYRDYKAVIFLSGAVTPRTEKALELCRTGGTPYLIPSAAKLRFSVDELRAFLSENGVRVFCEDDAIIYINENYLAVCAVDSGEKTVFLGRERSVREYLFDSGFGLSAPVTGDRITVRLGRHETKLFKLI